MTDHGEPSDKPKRQPYARPNDAWVQVPLPAEIDSSQPEVTVWRRSLRSRRRIFTVAVTSFFAGLLLVGLTSSQCWNLINPGPLSGPHAQIMATMEGNQCAACHSAASQPVSRWWRLAFGGQQENHPTQSGLCLRCHDKSLVPERALDPHNLDPEQLRQVARRQSAGSQTAAVGRVSRRGIDSELQTLICSDCHREHQGTDLSLSRLTDGQCQLCHQQTMKAFETDHPEFDHYPLQRRSPIAFDHGTHLQQHFPNQGATFNCQYCHRDDRRHQVQLLAPFEQACGTCHDQQIRESGQKGLTLFSLPMLDMTATEAAGLQVGSWPLAATGDFEGELPPLMRILLMADSKAAEILQRRDAKFEFSDLDPASSVDVADSVALAWSIKRLLFELAIDGNAAINRRWQVVTGKALPAAALDPLAGTLDPAVFQAAAAQWLPQLVGELQAQGIHGVSDLASVPSRLPANAAPTTQDSGSMQEQQAWPQDEAKLQQIAARLIAFSEKQEQEWLAENPIGRLLAGEKATPPSEPPPLDLPALPSDKDPPPTVVAPETASPSNGDVTFPPFRPDAAQTVGWLRDDRRFEIRYQGGGHADPGLRAWIDVVAAVPLEANQHATAGLYETLLSQDGLGSCRRCHTADKLPGRSGLRVHWQSQPRDPAIRDFTRFSHGPHLMQPGTGQCEQCHRLDPARHFQEVFAGLDGTQPTSNFFPIQVSQCAVCHRQGRAGNHCTECHHYHIGSRVTGD